VHYMHTVSVNVSISAGISACHGHHHGMIVLKRLKLIRRQPHSDPMLSILTSASRGSRHQVLFLCIHHLLEEHILDHCWCWLMLMPMPLLSVGSR
jgi:hypothetical protein